jgi:hypothetical protein
MSSHEMGGRWPRIPPAARGLRIAGMVLLGVVGAGLFALAFGWLVMILWNWLMPAIFHLGPIAYWQAFGLVVLAKLLFGGIHAGHGRPGRPRPPWKANPWGGNPWESRRRAFDEWRLYREFWEQEGREAFDRFAEKKQPGPSPEETGPKDA